MSWKYEDIVDLPRPQPRGRAPMSRLDRAAQFSPFAALTGYEETIEETARLTEAPVELDAGSVGELDAALRTIQESVHSQPEVTVHYFIPDSWKQGGSYETVRGRVRRLDPIAQQMQFTDGQILSFSRIFKIEVEPLPLVTGL